MVITKKIQVIVDEDNDAKRKEHYKTLRLWSDKIRQGANLISSHKFVQMQVSLFSYIDDEALKKTYTNDILKKEPGNSEQNATYRVLSKHFKGKGIPSEFLSTLNQEEAGKFKKNIKEYISGEKSIPCYRNTPIPFMAKTFRTLRTEKRTDKEGKPYTAYLFTLPGKVPMRFCFGNDSHAHNRALLDTILSGGQDCKLCGSRITESEEYNKKTGKKEKKWFVLLSVDIPKENVALDSKKVMYARLSVYQPLLCSTEKAQLENPGAGQHAKEKDSKEKYMRIGSKDEFLHRRVQIQEARRRAQMNAKYNQGGHGRSKKLAALDRWQRLEKNYCALKTHMYAKELVRLAVNNNCGVIYLMGTEDCEYLKQMKDEKDKFIIRNWSYYDLSSKIDYKAKRYGIKVVTPKKEKENETD